MHLFKPVCTMIYLLVFQERSYGSGRRGEGEQICDFARCNYRCMPHQLDEHLRRAHGLVREQGGSTHSRSRSPFHQPHHLQGQPTRRPGSARAHRPLQHTSLSPVAAVSVIPPARRATPPPRGSAHSRSRLPFHQHHHLQGATNPSSWVS